MTNATSNTIPAARVMAMGVTPWSNQQAYSRSYLATQAWQHAHPLPFSRLSQDDQELYGRNCKACAMVVALPDDEGNEDGRPNVGEWLSLYIRGRKPVPAAWFKAEMDKLETEAPAYYSEVLRDISTWGITEQITNCTH